MAGSLDAVGLYWRRRLTTIVRPMERWTEVRSLPIWIAFALLLAVGPLIASSSVGERSLINLIFFGSILGFAALGQHLVIVVGGIDLSVAPTITLSALTFASFAKDSTHGLLLAALAAIGISMCVGATNGLTVSILRINPLVATLGVSALAAGVAYSTHGAGAPNAVPESVTRLVMGRPIGGIISLVTVFWILALIVVAAVLRWTVAGRRFVLVGDNARGARAAGIHVERYRVCGYMASGFFNGVAGLAVAGVVGLPGIGVGDPYLIPAIASVIVGGTSLGGGVGSVAATAGGVLFVTHLDNLTLSMNAPTSVQLIVQGAVIVVALSFYGGRIDTWIRKEVARLRMFRGADGTLDSPGGVEEMRLHRSLGTPGVGDAKARFDESLRRRISR